MKGITGINHIGLRVRSLAVSKAFYETLGFQFIAGPIGPEPVAIVIHPCGVNINLILNASQSSPESNVLMESELKYPGYTHVALEIENYDIAIQEIKALAIKVTGEVEYNGAKFFFIRDPDSNVIEFHQPAR